MDAKPNIMELEALRSELIEKTLAAGSNRHKFFLYHRYFRKILSFDNAGLQEAFLKEFIEDFYYCLCRFELWGIMPETADNIINQVKQVTALQIASEYVFFFTSEISRLKDQQEKLELLLKGTEIQGTDRGKAYFPLIDKEAPEGFYGIIDSVTVRISRSAEKNRFIIIPSEKEIEKRILEQCSKSWILAIEMSKKYVKKPSRYHEIIISFDKKEGIYEGNSLGITLTLSFLEELLKYYNPAYVIKINEGIAFTGGISEKGDILPVSEEIINRKTAAVFFSDINTFVFPKNEESFAFSELRRLKESYPGRKLRLIPAEDMNDILDRRNLVEIKKQRPVVRTVKFVKRNWVSAAATVLLAIVFGYLFVIDLDDNPDSLDADAFKLYVKNKNGKLLWTKDISGPLDIESQRIYFKYDATLVDIENDGIKELLIKENQGRTISCYNKFQVKLWSDNFRDSVGAIVEQLNTEYSSFFIDTFTVKSQREVMLVAKNWSSFGSALYCVDLITGERVPGTFWASGHIMDAEIVESDSAGKYEVWGTGFDNGYDDLVFFVYEMDTLTKIRPTTKDYKILGYPESEMKAYIRFPKTDFDNYHQMRQPGYDVGSYSRIEDLEKAMFRSDVYKTPDVFEGGIGYEINFNFKDIGVVIDNEFRVMRDSLVKKGLLSEPYTDTEEYKNIIKSNILYWKEGKWVKREEIE